MICEHCGLDGNFFGGHNPSKCRDILKARLASADERWQAVVRIKDVTIEVMQKEALELQRWTDTPDKWTDAIQEAFPTRSSSHDEYQDAQTMVGNRHAKGELVALVNWLLVSWKRAEAGSRAWRGALDAARDVIRAAVDCNGWCSGCESGCIVCNRYVAFLKNTALAPLTPLTHELMDTQWEKAIAELKSKGVDTNKLIVEAARNLPEKLPVK